MIPTVYVEYMHPLCILHVYMCRASSSSVGAGVVYTAVAHSCFSKTSGIVVKLFQTPTYCEPLEDFAKLVPHPAFWETTVSTLCGSQLIFTV
jgi:hypothetical protein